ncbi:MAG TPA: tetratricopeptide repeat protein [Longimicrobium sp.]|nr:tetratricopeptide repeat protein [Longimicrobium sp.]
MSPATPAQVRQWSEEVAADPGSLAFLPLARAYREQGRRDAALKLVVRGLEKHPGHVEAHHLLGLLYREGGDSLKAFDEWDIALALDPEHGPSRREIGLVAWERGDYPAAVRHLERALENDAFDREVRAALEDAWARRAGSPVPRAAAAPPPAGSPAATPSAAPAAPAPEPEPEPAPVPVPAAAAPSGRDGSRFDAVEGEFGALGAERGIVGAVLLDDQGFVLAGRVVVGETDRGPEVAAILSGASLEAGRALAHLGLGAWKGILVETPEAVVRLAPAGDAVVLVAGRREVPTGWVLRVAARAREAALRFLGGGGAA